MSAGRINWWVLGLGALICLPLVWVLASGFGKDPHALPENSLRGKAAPEWTLSSLDGDEVALSELVGTPIALNFWASWCRPCLAEHPNLLEAAERYEGRVAFFGVAYDDDRATALKWLATHGSRYPNLWDPQHLTAVDYGVTGVPETFFIDREGLIADKVAVPLSFTQIVEKLEAML